MVKLISRFRYRFDKLFTLIRHRKEVLELLDGFYSRRKANVAEFGSLTTEETNALIEWINRCCDGENPFTVVEIGTLFGFTARQLAVKTAANIRAVDLFCWNPIGLSSIEHEEFTRSALKDTGVTLIKSDSCEYLKHADGIDFVFLDGDHSYEAVRRELVILKAKRIRYLSGHDFTDDFGVKRAVLEVLGEPDEVIGRCWFKKLDC